MTKGRGGRDRKKKKQGRKGNTRAHDWTDHVHVEQPGLSLTGFPLRACGIRHECPLGKEDGSTYLLTSFCQPLENLTIFYHLLYYPRPLSSPTFPTDPQCAHSTPIETLFKMPQGAEAMQRQLCPPTDRSPGPAFSPLCLSRARGANNIRRWGLTREEDKQDAVTWVKQHDGYMSTPALTYPSACPSFWRPAQSELCSQETMTGNEKI